MLLLDSLRDTFRDSQEAADDLAEGLREHLDGPARVVPLGEGSRALAFAVARQLPGCPVADRLPTHVPHTVVIVAERIRRIGPIDSLLSELLAAGAERILIATPLAEIDAAHAVDDRADAFVCLRRERRLGSIGRWYDDWTFATARPSAKVVPITPALRAAV